MDNRSNIHNGLSLSGLLLRAICDPRSKGIWKSRAPNKCKFFLWLALHDRCWTVDRRRRHGLQDTDACALCHTEPETINHLLITCSFSREVWLMALSAIGCQHLTPSATPSSIADWWTTSRKQMDKAARKTFDALVVLICWSVWLERNARTFDNRTKTSQQLAHGIAEEAAVWVRATYSSLQVFAQQFGYRFGRESVLCNKPVQKMWLPYMGHFL
ncbi:hypothetical protein HU200_022325 [Digitaria exilis]|uniref:Reverse transcriptase zinc-binding domain-containing protein n=1 Tax=Digitaria exilis TaxID=1010633 RepID=A0A835C556_9POAL|nr:hypothetical protein HU200_022325 [Digitaria exilis]